MRDFQAISTVPKDVNTKQLFPAGEQISGYSVWPVLVQPRLVAASEGEPGRSCATET